MTTLLITGADGFVGRRLGTLARERGLVVRAAVRGPAAGTGAGAGPGEGAMAVGDIGPKTEWSAALAGVDAVVHLAGRAHVLREGAGDPVAAARRVNVEGTRRLAEAMLAAPAPRRLVFVSTIHVHGPGTHGTPFDEDSPPRPHNAYAQSKWDAEEALRALAPAGLEPVIVRPALVYGPGVKGNLLRLLRLIDRGVPLPLGGVRNARSLLGVDNLCDLLLRCATHPRAAGQAFVAADATALSTPELVRTLAQALRRPARLPWAPPHVVGALLGLVGYGYPWQQLAGSLEVNAEKSRAFFGRSDPVSTAEGLAAMARWFREAAPARQGT